MLALLVAFTHWPAVSTLIDSFLYPRLGPGQMWEAARAMVRGREVVAG